MDPVPLERIVAACGGRLRWPMPVGLLVDEVSTDTRTIRPGALFIALRGERFDGREFLVEAFRRGALAAVAAPDEGSVPPPGPVIEVDDPVLALERIASWWRDEVAAERIAITGTVGKTTTKEFLGSILERSAPTTRAPKSFNNVLGVSLTLLRASLATRWIVCETGANAPGELSRLSRLALPSRAVVTEIGNAHLAGFGDLDGVVRAKSEVFEGLLPGGTAFIGEAVHGRERLVAAARAAGGSVVLFGEDRGDYRLTSWSRAAADQLPPGAASGFRFSLEAPDGPQADLFLPVPGRHNLLNALAAIAVARDAGLSWDEVRQGVHGLRLPPLRLDVRTVGGVTVIDDTYNASHRSVLAALGEACDLPLPPGGRRVLVLGDLLELGESSPRIHEELGRETAATGKFRLLLSVGTESRWAARGAEEAGAGALEVRRTDRVEDVPDILERFLLPGDLVLFKASRGMALDRAAEEVRRRLTRREEAAGPRPADGNRLVREGKQRACSSTSIS